MRIEREIMNILSKLDILFGYIFKRIKDLYWKLQKPWIKHSKL
jgi:hypothetical protein